MENWQRLIRVGAAFLVGGGVVLVLAPFAQQIPFIPTPDPMLAPIFWVFGVFCIIFGIILWGLVRN